MTGKTNAQIKNLHGDFVWYELTTPDAPASQAFYGGLLGWTFEDASFGDTEYRTFSGSEGQVGGMLSLSEEMIEGGAQPAWLGYLRVNDVDKTIEAVSARAGSLMFGPGEIPEVGPFAMLADPQGAPFFVIDDRSGQPSRAFAAYEPAAGHCAWNELVTADSEAAQRWYGELFGFLKDDAMDMGELGEYAMLRNASQDFVFGACMNKPADFPASLWLYYFRVPDIDKAVAYIGANGGQIINGPMEIPGGEYALSGIDPQGALFSLVGPRMA